MCELILEWMEVDRPKQYSIRSEETDLVRVRVGRDPSRCAVVLSDPTVSGLHIEIFFEPRQQVFRFKNLRESNPPCLNGHFLIRDETVIRQGDRIYLGNCCVQVKQITGTAAAPHMLLLAKEDESVSTSNPSTSSVNKLLNPLIYGLTCPNCHQVSAYEHLDLGCPWCGTSLAGAHSTLLS